MTQLVILKINRLTAKEKQYSSESDMMVEADKVVCVDKVNKTKVKTQLERNQGHNDLKNIWHFPIKVINVNNSCQLQINIIYK